MATTLRQMTNLSAYQLAGMVGVAAPDGPDSPGAVWLRSIRDDFVELATEYPDEATEDAMYVHGGTHNAEEHTHTAWRIFVDLCVYQQLADIESDRVPSDVGQVVYVLLEEVATALFVCLLNEWEESKPEEGE